MFPFDQVSPDAGVTMTNSKVASPALLVSALDYHRNGIAGAGYYRVRLAWRGDGKRYTGTAIVFDADGHAAINADDGTGFRCEDFEAELRAFINSTAGQRMAFPDTFR